MSAPDSSSASQAVAAASNAADAKAWAILIERLIRGLETGSRQWTVGRRKESVFRVLAANRTDMNRLRERLEPLLATWEDRGAGSASRGVEVAESGPASNFLPGDLVDAVTETRSGGRGTQSGGGTQSGNSLPSLAQTLDARAGGWSVATAALQETVQAALPSTEARARELAEQLAAVQSALALTGPTAENLATVQDLCERARGLLAHRHHLLDQTGALCLELTQGLLDLAEDPAWARGQADVVRSKLAGGVSAQGVRAAQQVLADARARQQRMRGERDAARDALRALIPRMLAELAALEDSTGRFEGSVERHAVAIGQADSLESMAGVVRALVEETRAVQQVVGGARTRLKAENDRALELQQKVSTLESELRRLSEEVSTDALTKVANRRGLEQAFEVERAKAARSGGQMAVALLDIDNFKKLNDSLGHAAGDMALKQLATTVQKGLRPGDVVARFGGEEFVVLLPATPLDEAQQVLTRLQRSLSASLFMHESKEVFVTFSAGVTLHRLGEPLAEALERADEGLYEAKRTGKNRTCKR